MRYVLSLVFAFIVAAVIFGGWDRGAEVSSVEAEFAPISIAGMVYEDGTMNILVRGVEITTIAEVVADAMFNTTIKPTAGNSGSSVMNRGRYSNLLMTSNHRLREDNEYMAYGCSAKRTVISYTMRYRA